MRALDVLSTNQLTKLEVSLPNVTDSKDIIGAQQFLNGSRDSDHVH